MLLPKALKMRAIKHTMALITDSSGCNCTKCASAQMPLHLRHLNPALLNRQGMSTYLTYPKMENGSELCHWKGQLVIGLHASPVRLRKPPQVGAKGPRQHDRFVLIGLCWLYGRNEIPPPQSLPLKMNPVPGKSFSTLESFQKMFMVSEIQRLFRQLVVCNHEHPG